MKRFRKHSHNILILLCYLTISLTVFLFLSCGADSQFTKKLVAQAFIAELFGETTKTIAISTEGNSHIAWMGLEWSADYKFFRIDQISVNGTVTLPEAPGSTALFQDISVAPSEGSSGVVPDETGGLLMVKITYAPLQALEAEDKPHKAYLLIAYDKPDLGTVRIELNGLVQGIAESKCSGASTSTQLKFAAKGGKFKLYMCDAQAVTGALANDPEGRANTNLAEIDISGTFVFYQPDGETICILGASDGVEPTIPDFIIPVPVEDAPVDELPVNLKDNSQAECSLSVGSILCNANVELEVMGGAVSVSKFTVTDQMQTPTSPDCTNFGAIGGAAGMESGGSPSLIAWGTVLPDPNTEAFQIDGALVVGVIELEPAP